MNEEYIALSVPNPTDEPDNNRIISYQFKLLSEYFYYREIGLLAEARNDIREADSCVRHMIWHYKDMTPWAKNMVDALGSETEGLH